ncbi:MAG TPA: histidine--tRNA ligase [Candidatus Sumerlaeota bacterium]|nr:histidine--tRNA ligase [Candidatus Sumerlaeota bacterium]
MTTFAPPRGMRDFYPEDFRARDALFSAWRETARLHGFEEYDAPVVETMELLERKAGEEISDQIYTFVDKSDRRLALRPELTPSLARMIIARQGALSFPLKWSAIGQCFRYERMTRGRKREHYQWNLDIVGEESVLAEAEVIGAAVAALRRLGLSANEFQVRVGSRAVLAELFARSGIGQEHFMACCLALDKRGKISDDEVARLLEEEGLATRDIERVFELLAITTLDQAAAAVGADSAALAQIRELFSLAGPLGFAPFLTFDLAVIRGLGYYTGIVFEAFDTAGKLRAIFGGGRYDSLLSNLGGQKMPCVGLGFGDVVVMELLADCGKLPATARRVDFAIGFMDDPSRDLALRAALAVRAARKSCDLALAAEKPKKFFARADRAGALHAIYIGPDEVQSGTFSIKPMDDRRPWTASLDSFAERLAGPA